MARLNVAPVGPEVVTEEGGRAARISPEQELRRTVMACLLWESGFYEDGHWIAARIKALVATVPPAVVTAIAIEARSRMNLRHVPLLLCRELARNKALRPETLADVIQRADELAEFLAIYWKDGRQPLAGAVKKGLARAFLKFNEYALAKYNRDGAVKLRDVLFLCHAKPDSPEREALWKRLVERKLAAPDTWEVSLSAGRDKRETFERLMAEGKLGALALLRNLRNMNEAGVPKPPVRAALAAADVRRVLPFRFIAAARHASDYEPELEALLFRATAELPKFAGRTVVMVDVSGSMDDPLSAKSDMRRVDAACGLAIVARELCEDVAVVSFSDAMAVVPPRRGFALRDAIVASQPSRGTYLAQSIAVLNEKIEYDRLIVVSDEQAHDGVSAPRDGAKGYMLNVGANRNGVGYGARWTHIDGFSEACVRYISEVESAR